MNLSRTLRRALLILTLGGTITAAAVVFSPSDADQPSTPIIKPYDPFDPLPLKPWL